MRAYEYDTAHLAVDRDGRVVYRPPGDDDPVPIGPVDDDPDWPARLGPEPAWYAAEVAELLDRWRDGVAFRKAIRDEQRRMQWQ
jgi:hypothetical protein